MRKLVSAVAITATVVASGVALAAPASADPLCRNLSVWGHGAGRCDSAPGQDGSFARCDAFYVFGFRATNCYRVTTPAPLPGPAPLPSEPLPSA